VLKVDKCFDKNAKFHFKIHLIPLKEHTPVVTKVPFSRQNAPDLFVRGPQDLQARKSRTSTGHQKLNVSDPAPNFDGISSVQNITFDSMRLQPGQVPNRRSKSPGIRFEANVSAHEQVVKNRRSKTVDLGKNEDSSLVLGSAVDSQTYVISEKSYDIGINENLEKKVKELENQVQVYQIQNKTLEERASVSHQNYLDVKITKFELKQDLACKRI